MKPAVDTRRDSWPNGVLSIRPGPGANCSSMGSAINLLFASGVLASMAAVIVSILASPAADAAVESEPDREGRPQAEPKDDD
jgi:hypothetical protein